MDGIIETLRNSMILFPSFTLGFWIRVILQIIIISYVIYNLLFWIKQTQAWLLLKGIVIIIIFTIGAFLLELNEILYILEQGLYGVLIALLIIFQPELRKGLEKIGSQNFMGKLIQLNNNGIDVYSYKDTFKEIADASFAMGKANTGALIVIKKEQDLTDIKKTGIRVDGVVTSQLLINIFEKNTPLHDGAIVIEGDRVASATCYLPLSGNMNISKDLGTRHRAALGMSESSDTIIITVSEETGQVSAAKAGQLQIMKDKKELIDYLLSN